MNKTPTHFDKIAEAARQNAKSRGKMLSQADRDLITLLRENARASTAELARRLGVSRTTVQSRIERLEARGIIIGYGVRLAPDYEQGLVRAHVLLTVAPKAAERVVKDLRALGQVRSLHSVSGSFDMIVTVESASISDLDALLDRIGAMDGVERTLSSIILSTRIDR